MNSSVFVNEFFVYRLTKLMKYVFTIFQLKLLLLSALF